MSLKIADWYRKEVFWWKWFSTVLWAFVFQLIGLALLNFDPRVFYPRYWIYDGVLALAIAGLASEYYEEAYSCQGSRNFRRLLISFFLHFTCGFGVLWAYSHFNNTTDAFILWSGSYFGLVRWYEDNFRRNGINPEFPFIPLPKKTLIRSKLKGIIKESIASVASYLRWFLITYVLFGDAVNSFFNRNFGLKGSFSSEEESWASYFSTLTRLSFNAWLLNALFVAVLKSLRLILNAYLTEVVEFDLEGEKSLSDAMDPKIGCRLLRHLAFLDFARLSAESPGRRASFFTLSQPGGHPHNWKKISIRCTEAVNEFIEELTKSTNPQVVNKKSEESDAKKSSTEGSSYSSPVPTSNLRMRRLASPLSSSTPIPEAQPKVQDPSPVKVVSRAILRKVGDIASLPDSSNIRTIFAKHSQLLMWTVEGLSNVISNSVEEDKFGVIQKDLSNVLSLLLNLQQVIERHKGMTVSVRKNKYEAKDSHLKNSLRNTVKSSLYRIAIAYGDHISFIPGLAIEHQQKLKNFYSFME